MYDRIILACTVLLAVVYLVASTQIPTLEIGDPLGPKAFPRLLGVALLVAAGIFALELWKERANEATREKPAEPLFDPTVTPVLAMVVVWTGVYYFIFEPLGFILATTIFLFPLMAWFNRGKWIANSLSAVGFSVLIYWMFVKLDVNLPQGVLPSF